MSEIFWSKIDLTWRDTLVTRQSNSVLRTDLNTKTDQLKFLGRLKTFNLKSYSAVPKVLTRPFFYTSFLSPPPLPPSTSAQLIFSRIWRFSKSLSPLSLRVLFLIYFSDHFCSNDSHKALNIHRKKQNIEPWVSVERKRQKLIKSRVAASSLWNWEANGEQPRYVEFIEYWMSKWLIKLIRV